MRLIDADELLYDLFTSSYPQDVDIGKAYYIIKEELKNAPTVNAVSVVRCKDCKYASFSMHQGELYISCENTGGLFRDVPEDGYCYCGEKVTE